MDLYFWHFVITLTLISIGHELLKQNDETEGSCIIEKLVENTINFSRQVREM